MRNSGVYLIKNKINEKIYIGSTIDFKERWNKHITGKGNKHLFNSFEKYGLDNFDFVILEYVDSTNKRESLFEKEQKWMDFYDIKNNKTYNKRFIAIPNKTEKRDESFREKMSKIRLELSIGSKPVNQYSLDGVLIKKWRSSAEIERSLNFRARNISGACKGEQHTAFGFIWKFESQPLDDSVLIKIKNKRPKNKGVIQKNLDGEVVNTFESMTQAANGTGFNYSRIGIACNQKKKYNGFLWEFTTSHSSS